ncbi:MAG: hypothetical protein IJ506_01995 [Clostridia bacterium]|nr:hypothetical protein [Clostridia bacterium]
MRKKLVALFISGALALTCGVSGLITQFQNTRNASVSAEMATLEIADLETSYLIGSSFTVPEKAMVDIGGTKMEAENGVLIYPDGSVREKGTYTLSENGKYTLSYSVIHDGKTFKAEKEFVVNGNQYTFGVDGKTATYGELTMSTTKETGLTIALSAGDTFRFNAPFDISGMDVVDICKLYPVEIAKGVYTHPTNGKETVISDQSPKYFIVRLVDCYDDSNYIEMVMGNNQTTGGYYYSAGASYQELYGVGNAAIDSASPNYAGAWKIPRTSALNYHLYGAYSSGGATFAELASVGGMNFAYYPETNRVGAQYTKKSLTTKIMVNDLDNSILYEKNPFKGFTTGEVYLTISCSAYRQGLTQEIEIASLFGLTGEELANLQCVDATPPKLVKPNGISEDKTIIVTKGETFYIPELEVYDLNYGGDTQVRCYYNYGLPTQSTTAIINGSFVPKSIGEYTLEYTIKDTYGNATVFLLTLCCIERDCITYSFVENTGKLDGATYFLPEVQAESINGEVNYTVAVVLPTGEVKEVKDDCFVLETLGEYKVVYTFSDGANVKTVEKSYDFTNKDSIYFTDEISLKKYYIKSAQYSFDDYVGYKLSESGFVPQETKMYVSSDDGAYQELTDAQQDEYKITATKNIQVKYVCDGVEIVSQKIPVVDVHYGTANVDYSKYFVGEHTFNAETQGYDFTFSEDKQRTEFINPLSVSNFEFNIEILEDVSNFTQLNWYLEDAMNANNVLKVSIKKNLMNGLIYYTIDDGEDLSPMSGTAILNIPFVTGIDFSYSNGQIISNKGITIDVPESFSNLCYLSFEIEGREGESGLRVKKLNNQYLRLKISEAKPMVYFERKVGAYKLGNTVEVNTASYTSVFHPTLKNNTTVTVCMPGGKEIAKDVQGNVLENVLAFKSHQFKADTLGYYIVKYTATVNDGVKTLTAESIPYNFVVIDQSAPTVRFTNGANENTAVEVNVGETHKIYAYEVVDDTSSGPALFSIVVIYDEYGNLYDFTNNGLFKFQAKGKYAVTVLCRDAMGNFAKAYYYVLVK